MYIYLLVAKSINPLINVANNLLTLSSPHNVLLVANILSTLCEATTSDNQVSVQTTSLEAHGQTELCHYHYYILGAIIVLVLEESHHCDINNLLCTHSISMWASDWKPHYHALSRSGLGMYMQQ